MTRNVTTLHLVQCVHTFLRVRSKKNPLPLVWVFSSLQILLRRLYRVSNGTSPKAWMASEEMLSIPIAFSVLRLLMADLIWPLTCFLPAFTGRSSPGCKTGVEYLLKVFLAACKLFVSFGKNINAWKAPWGELIIKHLYFYCISPSLLRIGLFWVECHPLRILVAWYGF